MNSTMFLKLYAQISIVTSYNCVQDFLFLMLDYIPLHVNFWEMKKKPDSPTDSL